MKRSERLRSNLKTIEQWQKLFTEYRESVEFLSDPTGLSSGWFPLEGREERLKELHNQLHRLGAKAKLAAEELTVGFVTVHPAPALRLAPQTFSIFTSWETAFSRPTAWSFGVEEITSTLERAIGTFDAEIDQAERVESTFAGKVAAVLGFPARVREAMGLPADRASGRAVQISLTAILWLILSTTITTLVGGALKLIFGF